mgnify:CR=1 FL=1
MLDDGQVMTEVLKQRQYNPLPVEEEVAIVRDMTERGIIVAPERGLVDFAIPLMREHLRAHPHDAQLGLPTRARETFHE